MARPIHTFHGFCGQKNIVRSLTLHCLGALQKGGVLLHVLLGGPSGMGKTALARAVAKQLGTNCIELYCSKGTRKAQVATLLATLKKGDVFFVDEAHALPVDCQEVLYPAIDSRKAPKLDAKGKRPVEGEWVDIAEFTLIAATDQPGKLRNALMQRLVLRLTLAEYDQDEMKQIVLNHAAELTLLLTPQSANIIASACRGTPRRARHLLQSLHACTDSSTGPVTAAMAHEHLDSLGIDERGLTAEDRRCLHALDQRGGPVSLNNLAKMCGQDPAALQRDVEPWLLQRGWIGLASRGRFLTPAGRDLLTNVGAK